MLGALLDFGTNLLNLGLQKKQFDYQRDLNNLTMQREDNAIQRRMEDLSKAGLNPYLAGSSGASASSFSSGQAPQLLSGVFGEAENRFIKKKQQKKDFEYIDNQIDKMSSEVQNIQEQNRVIQEQQEKYRLENEILKKQMKQYEDSGFYPTSPFGKLYFDILNAGRAFPEMPLTRKILNFGLQEQLNTLGETVNQLSTEIDDSVGRNVTEIKNKVNPVSKDYKESSKTNKNLANTLNKAFGDSGFFVSFYDGKFQIDNTSSRIPEHKAFDSYQEALHYIKSQL